MGSMAKRLTGLEWKTPMTLIKSTSQQWRKAMLASVAAPMVLVACAEEEIILPGAREDLRGIAVDETLINQSRAFSAPAARTNATWTQFAGTPAFRTTNPTLSAAPQLIWSSNIGEGDSRKLRITADPVVTGDRIFTLDADATVVSTSTSGATVWSKSLVPDRDNAGEATGGGLAVEGDTVYVSVGYGTLTALEAATGTEKWTQKLDAAGSGTPTIVGDLVYLVAGDDTGWAIEKDSGRIAWQISATSSVANVLDAPAPVVADGLAIFSFGSGEVVGVFQKGGLRRWDSTVAGQRAGRALGRINDITGAPVVDGNTVYVGNHAGRSVALSLGSGTREWTARTGAIGPVWPAGDSVFAISDLNELIRLDAADGSQIWAVELPNYVKDKPRKRSEVVANYGPVLAGGRLLVASNDGLLRSFNPEDGSLLGTTEIPGGATTAPVIAGGVLYVVGANGQLHAFR